MKDKLEQRLEQLKAEYVTGNQRLMQTRQIASDLRDTLMRISGAIQVIEEELARVEDESLDNQVKK